jgi:hypothetical protein
MDIVYQIIVLKTFYPVEALLIGLLAAFVPYMVMRGVATRAARHLHRDASPGRIR